MKKNNVIYILLLFVLFITEIVRINVFGGSFNYIYVALKDLFFLFLIIYNMYKFNTKNFYYKYINYMVLILELFSVLFGSTCILGFSILFFMLFLLSVVIHKIMNKDIITSYIFGICFLLFLFLAIALLNLLSISSYVLYGLFVVLLIIVFVTKKDDYKSIMKNEDTQHLLLLSSILFIISILGGVGRYIHSWDEYSYWGYAAKVLISEKNIYTMIDLTIYYPPISSLWHFIVATLCGYSESNLYIGLTFITFVFFMPVLNTIYKYDNIFKKVAVFLVILFIPTIFNGSINYGLIYVDLLLSGIITFLFIQTKKNNKLITPEFIVPAIIAVYLKPNGFVYVACIIFYKYIVDLISEKVTVKDILKKGIKYLIPVISFIVIFFLWRFGTGFVSKTYDLILLPDVLKTDLLPKLNSSFILNFVSSLFTSFDSTIIFSFIEIPLFVFLIIISYLLVDVEKVSGKRWHEIIIPFAMMYIVFYLLTAISLFVEFSYYEASKLASFVRYLSPMNILLIEYVLFNLSNIKKDYIKKLIITVCICLIGFQGITYFVSDIRARRDTYNWNKYQMGIYKEVIEKTEEDDKIYVINQQDVDSIMPKWYARFYLYPRRINGSGYAIDWKVLTDENVEDLGGWGFDVDDLKENLIKYKFDYLFLYTTTDELLDLLEEDFENKSKDRDCKLFKIGIDESQKITFYCKQ